MSQGVSGGLAVAQPVARFSWRERTPAQRNALIAAALGWMLDAFDVLLYSLVLAQLMRNFGMSKTTAGLLNSLTLVASALGALLFGILSDRYGRMRMLIWSVLTYSISTALCGLSVSVLMLAVMRFVLGLGMGGEWNTGTALVAETWPAELRGRALGIVQSSWAVGYAAAAVMVNAVLARWNWRVVFFIGIVPALLTLWMRGGVPEPELWVRHSREQKSLRQPSRVNWRDFLWGSAPLRYVRSGAILLAMNTFGMFAWWGLFTWLPAYLELPVVQGGRGFQLLGSSSFLVVLNLAGMLPGYLLFGVFADRIGRRRTLVLYLAAAALLVPWFAVARHPGAILLSGSLVAFFGTGFFTGSGIVGSELFPTAIRATALGVTYNFARGLSALAPLIIGRVGEPRGLSYAFLACAVSFGLAAVCAVLLPETRDLELV